MKYLQNKFYICHRQPAESSCFCAFKSKRGPQHLTAAAARLGPPQSPTPPWWPAAGWCSRRAAAAPMNERKATARRRPSFARVGPPHLRLLASRRAMLCYAMLQTKLLSRSGLNHLHFYEKTYQRPLTPLGPGQVYSTDLIRRRKPRSRAGGTTTKTTGFLRPHTTYSSLSSQKKATTTKRAMTSEATWWIRATLAWDTSKKREKIY